MNRVVSCILACVLAAVVPSTSAQIDDSTETIRLVRFPKSANQFVAAQLVEEICRRSRLTVKIEPMPPKRANLEVLSGRVDGEVSRIEKYFVENPALIRVTPSYSNIAITAFSRQRISVNSRDDLSKYKVGIVRGVQTSIDLTAEHPSVEQASNSESLFAMLGAGRFDIAIDVNVNGQFAMQKLGLDGVRDVGTLLRSEVFIVLSPRRGDLAERLSSSISAMKRSGDLDRLKKKFDRDFVLNGIEPN